MQKKTILPVTALIVCLFQAWTCSAISPGYYSGKLAFMAVFNGKYYYKTATCDELIPQNTRFEMPVDVPVLRPAFVYLSSGVGLYAVTESEYGVISVKAYYKSDSFAGDSFTEENVGSLTMSDLQVDEDERFELVQTRTSQFVGTFTYHDLVNATVTIDCEKWETVFHKFPGRSEFSQSLLFTPSCGRYPLPAYMLVGAENLQSPCCN